MNPDAVPAGETLLRLAVLLQAGVSPVRAWGYVADSGDAAAVRVRAQHEAGVPLVAAIASAGDLPDAGRHRARERPRPAPVVEVDAWQDIAAAWEIATTVGAPIAETLRTFAVSLRDAQEAGDDVRVALAEPASTARLMGWLPLVAVLLGVALGFDTLGTLVGNPIGIACLVAGVLLVFAGHQWNARLVHRARPSPGIPGLEAELMAIALSGGISIDRARDLVADASGRAAETATDTVLALSRSAGVPAVELLHASSAMARHRARIDGRLRAARLSSRLLLPLGVCTLPAFLLLGVAPMLLSVMTVVPLSL